MFQKTNVEDVQAKLGKYFVTTVYIIRISCRIANCGLPPLKLNYHKSSGCIIDKQGILILEDVLNYPLKCQY